MKRWFIISLIVMLLLPLNVDAAAYDPQTLKEGNNTLELQFYTDKPDIGFYINSSANYILETVPNPGFGTISGEWSVFGLLRGMYTGAHYMENIPPKYFENYIQKVEQRVAELEGELDRNKSTEWSRAILSLTALGYDITDVNGYDFIDKLSQSFKFSYSQGINGPIWETISMNTGNYQFVKNPLNADQNNFAKMIDYVLKKEIIQTNGTVGGWALSGKLPDPDITGMALQALAPYYLDKSLYDSLQPIQPYENLAIAVERAIAALADIQNNNGGYKSWGTLNSESTVQVIVALTALNIDPLTENLHLPALNRTVSFIKEGAVQDGVWTNNMVDALLSFYALNSGKADGVGGFKHVTLGYDGGGGSGTGVNDMATDQALYGLIAYDRYLQNQSPLYNISDMKNGEYKSMKAKELTLTYVYNDGKVVKETYAPYELVTLANSNGWKKSQFANEVFKKDVAFVMPRQSITLYEHATTPENTTVFDAKVIHEANKSWKVHMSKAAANTAANKAAFTIRDEQGKEYPAEVTISGKTVNVKPLFTYKENQYYFINVEANVSTIDGHKAIKTTKMPFIYQVK